MPDYFLFYINMRVWNVYTTVTYVYVVNLCLSLKYTRLQVHFRLLFHVGIFMNYKTDWSYKIVFSYRIQALDRNNSALTNIIRRTNLLVFFWNETTTGSDKFCFEANNRFFQGTWQIEFCL